MDEFPICCNCRKRFSLKGPPPFLLPCLHTACETCVVSVAGGTISCCTCHRQFDLSKTTLPKDIVRQREIFHLTVKHQPSQLLCTHEQDGNQAVGWCLECEELLCEHCQNLHESFKSMRKHTVHKIDENTTLPVEQDRLCTVHPKYILVTYDKDCDILTCARCNKKEHSSHNLVEVEQAYDSVQSSLNMSVNNSVTIQDRCIQALDSIEQQARNTEEADTNLKETVSLTFTTLRTLLDQREKEVLIDLDRCTSKNQEGLDQQRSEFESVQENSTLTLDYVKKALEYSSTFDLLTLQKTLTEVTQECQDSATRVQAEHLPLPVFTTHGLGALKAKLACLGNITPRGIWSGEESIVENTVAAVAPEMTTTFVSCRGAVKVLVDFIITTDSNQCLLRPCLQYDVAMVNLFRTYINSEGQLINTGRILEGELYEGGTDQKWFKKYSGTGSTEPLLRTGSPQYWEFKAKFDCNRLMVEQNLLLEIGLSREEECDNSIWIGDQPHSYSLVVLHCSVHRGMCRAVYRHGKYVKCIENTFTNTVGTSGILHFGVLCDEVRKIVAFVDVGADVLLHVITEADFTQELWPMFGLGNESCGVSLRAELLVGNDIALTEDKKYTILEAIY